MKNKLEALIKPCILVAKKAGIAIAAIYDDNVDINIQIKADSTPVTRADLTAHQIIVDELKKLTPTIPILSEEAANISYATRQQWQTYWLIDPLDGTKEFIHKTGEFTVNIALIHRGHAILGIIYAPILDWCYYAYANAGAFKQIAEQPPLAIHTSKITIDPIRVIVSRRHNLECSNKFIATIPAHVKVSKGSSLKTCMIAEGLADVYPCFGKTSEWDMGAAQCIIEEAGGLMVDLKFHPIQFNQKDSLLNPPLLVVGDKDYNWQQYLAD